MGRIQEDCCQTRCVVGDENEIVLKLILVVRLWSDGGFMYG